MSHDIKMKATYKGHIVRFNLPYTGNTVDLDFNGIAMIQAAHVKHNTFHCRMELTGKAMDGRGVILEVDQNEVFFEKEQE